jgi:large subunit ribosomal protein MRP49
LKYHNPSVQMAVDRTETQDGPATMAVHFAEENASEAKERIETINMKSFTSSEILDALVRLTKAYPIEPTPEDREELAKLDEQQKRSERDSKLSQEVRAKAKREAQLLEQARGDVAAQSA